MRRAGHEGVNKAMSTNFYPVQLKEALTLTASVLQNPSLLGCRISKVSALQCYANIKLTFKIRTAASTVMSIIYDLPAISSCDDPSLAKVNDFVIRLVHSVFPGNHLVEFFTWMNYFPPSIAKWKRVAQEGFQEFSELFEGMFHDVERRIVSLLFILEVLLNLVDTR